MNGLGIAVLGIVSQIGKQFALWIDLRLFEGLLVVGMVITTMEGGKGCNGAVMSLGAYWIIGRTRIRD